MLLLGFPLQAGGVCMCTTLVLSWVENRGVENSPIHFFLLCNNVSLGYWEGPLAYILKGKTSGCKVNKDVGGVLEGQGAQVLGSNVPCASEILVSQR